jgi:hypothetical protein
MRYTLGIFISAMFFIYCFLPLSALPEEKSHSSTPSVSKLNLVQAQICEQLRDCTAPQKTILFSVTLGKIFCFTDFDPVYEQTSIYHQWFFRDKLITRQRLVLKPPRWSTFSSIDLREADKGPWYVKITDQGGHTLRILRFSITD